MTLQTDDRNVNIIETTENEPDEADTILRGTENETDLILSDLHCLTITVLPDFAVFRQLK